jgi:adenylosuccinate synthase
MKEKERNFIVVNGIALGEETKGNTVQSLVRKLDAHTVWRSGGWQGGHHITHDDGREAALSFFGAGVFEGAKTYLKHMVISPAELFQETVELEEKGIPNSLSLIAISQDCLSTTPFHSAISRIREILRGKDKKGTIGKGAGEAILDSVDPELTIRAGDFKDRAKVQKVAENIRRSKLKIAEELIANHQKPVPEEVYGELKILKNSKLVKLIADASLYLANMIEIVDDNYLENLLAKEGSIINEVSHGVLHHPWYGFVPHVTQIDPTSQNVIESVNGRNYRGKISRIGVVRSYMTRHGAGPLVSFNPKMTRSFVETHNNAANDWLGEFRVGNFDIVALKYALSVVRKTKAVDGLVVSYLDALQGYNNWQVCEAYEYVGKAKDLEDYFYLDGKKIVGIKLYPDTRDEKHHQHQVRLTQLLKKCHPILKTIKPAKGKSIENSFIEYVESELEIPVVGKGYGPKIKDRHFLPHWQEIIEKGK